MNFIRILCTNSFNNCIIFFKKNKELETNNTNFEIKNKDENSLYDEENEAFQAWPNDTINSLNINRSNTNNNPKIDVPISKITIKPVLIGNIDEDKLVKKANVTNLCIKFFVKML